MDDTDLVARMVIGDHEAISQLYARYSGPLMALALRFVKTRQEAEDLVHDVFVEAWRRAATFDPRRGRVWTWLAIRMRSRALDRQLSARVTRNAGEAPLAYLSVPAPASAEHVRVRAALAALGSEHRRIVELAYYEGLSCSEIAARVAIPLGTVKSRLASGLHRLRAQLDHRAAA